MVLETPQDFFKIKRTTSEIKAEFLPALFASWCNHYLSPTENIPVAQSLLYIDANANSGSVEEEKSAAFKIITKIKESAATHPDLTKVVQLLFVPENKLAATALQTELEEFLNEEEITPRVEILGPGTEINQANYFGKQTPFLVAADPFRGIHATTLAGQELPENNALFFLSFTYQSLKKALQQEESNKFLEQLWGDDLKEKQQYFSLLNKGAKAEEWLSNAVVSGFYVHNYNALKFKINAPATSQASYIVIATRQPALFREVREKLANYSDLQDDGVPLWGSQLRFETPSIPGLFQLVTKYCLANLVTELGNRKADFHYKSIQEIYESHSPETPYILVNYLAAFEELRKSGKINTVNDQNKSVKALSPKTIIFYKLHLSSKS